MGKDNSESILSLRQRRFLGFVSCFAGVWVLGFLLIGAIVVLQQFFDKFSGVIWSLAVAGMLAIILRPVVAFLDSKLRFGRFLSIMLLYLLVVGTAGSTIWLVGAKVVEQVRELAVTAVDWPDTIDKKAKGWLPEDAYEAVSDQTEIFKQYWREMFGVDGSVPTRFTKEESAALDELEPADHKVFLALDEEERAAYLLIDETDERNVYLAKKAEEIRNRNMETFGQQGEQIAEQSAKVLKSAWSSLLGFFTQLTYLAVIPIYMFYFLGSKRDLLEDFEQELGFLSPRVREDVVFLIREFVGILVAFFRGQLLIGLLMGVGYAIGFQISGLKFGLALGLFFGLLNVVPYLGSIIGIVTALLIAYLQPAGIAETGQWGILLGCGITFGVVQLIESYLLTPRIMGRQTGLHPVVVIVAIFFWGTALGGILGMIFGIPLTAFIIIAWRLLRRKYLLDPVT
jgi:predicted PurR-regulated permease PerM